jgi:hypothetical protein
VQEREVMDHQHERAGIPERREVLHVERVNVLVRRRARQRPQYATQPAVLRDGAYAEAGVSPSER